MTSNVKVHDLALCVAIKKHDSHYTTTACSIVCRPKGERSRDVYAAKQALGGGLTENARRENDGSSRMAMA